MISNLRQATRLQKVEVACWVGGMAGLVAAGITMFTSPRAVTRDVMLAAFLSLGAQMVTRRRIEKARRGPGDQRGLQE